MMRDKHNSSIIPEEECEKKRGMGSQAQEALERARSFLRGGDEEGVEKLVEVLRQTGAAECWHKHGTFLEHLRDVYRILKLWGAPDFVALCGLFHSAYSNSYVNLAIFQPDMDRQVVRDLVGSPAEHLIHLFCVVPRHQIIHDMLLFRFTDQELIEALQQTDSHSISKLRAVIPPKGLAVKHIRTGDTVNLPRAVVAQFLLLTMADFSDQLMGWQDQLFGNEDGTLSWPESNWTALWPGDGKPGLWMSAISRMGILLNLILREENANAHAPKLQLPPVFDDCTAILNPADQIKARDAYWDAVQLKASGLDNLDTARALLQQACKLNPWVGEPHVLLAQVYLSQGKFELAEAEASKGMNFLLDWGTNWDKRMSWEAWVAWSRVLLNKAQEKVWPHSAWGINNLGLVK